MSKKHLSRKPHYLPNRPDIWWYEQVDGIEIYCPRPHGTDLLKITWGQLRQALKRKDKKP